METVIRKQTSFRLREDLLQSIAGTRKESKQKPKQFCREHFDGCDVFRTK